MNARTFVVVMSKPGMPARYMHTHAFTTVVVPTWSVDDEKSLEILQAAFADKEWMLEASKQVQALVGSAIVEVLARAFAQRGIVFQTDIVETP